MANTITVRLMRHAPTLMNQRKQYMGWTDAPIVPDIPLPVLSGTQQIVYGSDLLRCQQTAKAYFPQATYMANAGFRELNFGAYEGQSYAQLKDNAQYCAWLDDPYNVTPPNGEPFAVFLQRVQRTFLTTVITDCIIMSHGGVVRALLSIFDPQQGAYWSWQAGHNDYYDLTWRSLEALKEGQKCIALSVGHITENTAM